MSEPASISTGIAQRYATAIFELSLEDKSLGELESGIDDLSDALNGSADLRDLITSPLVSRDAQGRSIAKIAEKMELIPVLQKTLALMAEKRRLFVLPQLIEQLHTKIADHKGEVTAEVVTVKPLTKTQIEKLSKSLAARVGKSVKINATVDDTLVGGLVVKVGSKMIDTSIRSKLASLQNEMKEVG
ncbi:F0F1 ATP synthase subunit delta [Pseudopelagicola sp. nBUS_20]|uniref:F0F1 ATP synthase subunit delta n=1 Tax=Pseudopelagicola sp. nBUS_20 TaxID=3395317 RepID=UPI003EBACBF1